MLFSSLQKEEIAIDCGANVGENTRKMAKNGATVYAFEPNPFAFGVLERNFKKWPNVICINKGIWISEGKMRLYFHENSDQNEIKWSSGSSLLANKCNVNLNKYLEVEVINFNEFIRSMTGRIRVIKIDIEGAEGEILRQIIAQKLYIKVDAIIVETHDHKIPELKESMAEIRREIANRNIENIHLDWI